MGPHKGQGKRGMSSAVRTHATAGTPRPLGFPIASEFSLRGIAQELLPESKPQISGAWVVIPAGGTPESAPDSRLCLLGCLLPG